MNSMLFWQWHTMKSTPFFEKKKKTIFHMNLFDFVCFKFKTQWTTVNTNNDKVLFENAMEIDMPSR